jgi:hypothetical protein
VLQAPGHLQREPQQPGRLPTIGFLGAATASAASPWVASFVKRLGELGWIESRNVTTEYRWAEEQYDRLPALAADLGPVFS